MKLWSSFVGRNIWFIYLIYWFSLCLFGEFIKYYAIFYSFLKTLAIVYTYSSWAKTLEIQEYSDCVSNFAHQWNKSKLKFEKCRVWIWRLGTCAGNVLWCKKLFSLTCTFAFVYCIKRYRNLEICAHITMLLSIGFQEDARNWTSLR